MPDTESQNVSPGEGASPGLVVHVAGPAESAGLAAALRSADNAVAALAAGVPVEVVVQGPGVVLLATGSTLGEAIGEAVGRGIRIHACGNSLRSVELIPGQLLPGVGSVPAAISYLATRQWEGWAYIRL